MNTPPTRDPVRGWMWRANNICQSLNNWTDVRRAWEESDTRVWIDLENPSREDIKALDEIIDLDDEALEDCLDGPERPRIDEYENYLALFFYGVVSVHEKGDFSPHKLVAFCGENFLVTVHPDSMLSIQALHKYCKRHGSGIFERGVDALLFRLIDSIVDNYLELLDHFEDDVIKLEVAAFDPKTDKPVLQEVARMRSELMDIRRLAAAQISLLTPLARGEFDYISTNLGTSFRHIEEHLAHTLDLIQGLRERLSDTLNIYHSTLTKRTNDIVRALTVFAAVLLPMSLIAGIYGMNVPVWPPSDQPLSFWGILGLMALVGTGLAWFFRTRKWF